MLEGQDVIGVLPTGFGKSMLFHLLPHFIPVKTTKNIVIVVCPLNSIIEDQLKVLKARRITADVLQLASYDKILVPIAYELAIQRENYPMTIIYLKLKYCGYAYGLFERVLKDKQCVGETSEPSARLFAQFHAPQTSRMKKEQSRVRVLFATSALGMGVDAPYVTNIIHITPPSSLEAYMQEIGRAGRTGLSSCATLYYNNSDIAKNKKHVEESMKSYCRSEDTCQWKLLLDYFGFSSVQQKGCCCICDGKFKRTEEDLPQAIRNKVRLLPNSNRAILERLVKSAISDHVSQATSEGSMLFDISLDKDLAAKVMEGVEFVASEVDLLKSFGIWDGTCSSQIFSLISEHTTICTTETDSDND
ncbi:recQ-like DNA helicase BLM [Montipora foliosa]|uniref:recQ-like DNA helicase BLM n=1 Tax=Montipora foliosa TaxID=591990 RepID=UPI0035F1D560